MRILPAVLLVCLLVPAVASATEPPCDYPTCFPAVGDFYAKRVFTNGKARLEMFPFGQFGPSRMAIVRMVDDKVAGPYTDVFVIEAPDKKGTVFRFFAPQKPIGEEYRLNGTVDDATTVTVTGMGSQQRVFTFDEAATKRVSLKTATRDRQRQMNFQEYEYHLGDAQTNLDEDLKELKTEYGVTLVATVDGSGIKLEQLDEVDTSNVGHICRDVVSAISAMCQRGKCEAVKKGLKSMNCHLHTRKKSTATLKDGVFDVQLSITSAREGKNSFNGLAFLERRLK